MEPLFKRILTPVDLGSSSIAALHYTSIFAKRFGSSVTLVYADELASLFADYDPAWVAYHVQPQSEGFRIEDSLRAFAAEHLRDVESPATIVVPEHPVKAIIRAATETNADLIVMGTHGRRGWRRALAGSVADGVVRAAARPVLVVPEQRHRSAHPEEVTRVVCPVNFTEAARTAVVCAAGVAAAFDAELIVVHVAEVPIADTESIQEYFRQWLGEEIRARSSFRELVLRGGAAERVLDCVEDVNADLLVLGAEVKWLRNESVIGTTTERLLRFSPVPVLTVARTAFESSRQEAAMKQETV